MPRHIRVTVGNRQASVPQLRVVRDRASAADAATWASSNMPAKPDATNTGPRSTPTGAVLSSSEAISAARAGGGVLEGRFIDGILQFTDASHGGLVFRDCEISGGGYNVGCWQSPSQHTRPTPGSPVVFEYCRMVGGAGTSANIIGYDWVLRHCDVTHGIDGVKPYGNNELFACWVHDTYHPEGAHCDCVQVANGNDFLIHWCNLEGWNSPDSPENPGSVNNACLQTGKTLGPLTNWRMEDCWVDGGVITVRGPDNPDGHAMDMVFRRNKHGREWAVLPIARMSEAGADYDDSNIFLDTGQPVNDGW